MRTSIDGQMYRYKDIELLTEYAISSLRAMFSGVCDSRRSIVTIDIARLMKLSAKVALRQSSICVLPDLSGASIRQ